MISCWLDIFYLWTFWQVSLWTSCHGLIVDKLTCFIWRHFDMMNLWTFWQVWMLFLARVTCGHFYVVYLCIFDTLYLWASGHISHVLHMNLLTCFTCCIVEILHFWALWTYGVFDKCTFCKLACFNCGHFVIFIHIFLTEICTCFTCKHFDMLYLWKFGHGALVDILTCFTCRHFDMMHLLAKFAYLTVCVADHN